MGPLTFYFDRCVGRRFPEALQKLTPPFEIEFHHSPKNRFPQNTPDDEWLSVVGGRGWLVFSHDRRFHQEQVTVAAIKQHSIGCFCLWGAEDSAWHKLRCFVRGIDRIMDAAITQRPFIYIVSKRGGLTSIPMR